MPTTTTATSSLIARLAALCDGSGFTRTETASRMGTSQGNLSRLLSGDRNPSLSTVARLLAAIGCQWGDLD